MLLSRSTLRIAASLPQGSAARRDLLRAVRASRSDVSPGAIAMLRSIARGTKIGKINPNVLTEALAAVGWTVTEEVGIVQMKESRQMEKWLPAEALAEGRASGHLSKSDLGCIYFDSAEQADRAEQILHRKITVVPKAPTNPVSGQVYAVKMRTVPSPWNPTLMRIEADLWLLGVPGYRIESPKGSSVTVAPKLSYKGNILDPVEDGLPGLWQWAYKNGLQETCARFIEDFGGDEAAARASNPGAMRSLDNTGTCGCCFNNVKLTSGGEIMRHGWKVQGYRSWGSYGNSWHSSACFGMGYPPFERSKASAVDYLKEAVQPSIKRAHEALREHLKYPDTLTHFDYRGKPTAVPKPENFDPKDRWTPYAEAWRVIRGRIEKDIGEMEQLERTLEARIAAWKPMPLPGEG